MTSSALRAKGPTRRQHSVQGALNWRITNSFQAPSCPENSDPGTSMAKEWTVDSAGRGLGSGLAGQCLLWVLGVSLAPWASGVWTRPSPRPLSASGLRALRAQASLEMEAAPASRNGCLLSHPPLVRLQRLGWKRGCTGEEGRWGWKSMSWALPLKYPHSPPHGLEPPQIKRIFTVAAATRDSFSSTK